ncbi:MAG: alpha/beta hydrolase family protein [Flavobacteriales bacterium]
MKILTKLTFSSLFVVFVFQSMSQNISGSWTGYLTIKSTSLKIVFHFAQSSNQYKGTLDSPEQGAYDIPIKEVQFKNNELLLDISAIGGKYEAILTHSDTLSGTFIQGGQKLPLTVVRSNKETQKFAIRPQEPKPKFNYKIEEVKFTNEKANIKLAGTITKPNGRGPFPAVVLASGSGPQDRNEEIFNHKPFLVIADYLTNNGIAVLRYDDRGVAESEGDFSSATSADFADDAKAAFEFLKKQKNIDSKKVGIIGHSEGGMIAPMVAAEDNSVRFIILLAGPGIPIEELLILQTRKVAEAEGTPTDEIEKALAINVDLFDVALHQKDEKKAIEQFEEIITKYTSDLPNEERELALSESMKSTSALLTPWFRFFIGYNPQTILEKVKCPVLAINGDKDVQVTAEENLAGIKKALEKGGNKNYSIHNMKGLNHLLQTANTGAVSEYAKIEETISPDVLKLMKEWILNQKK